MRIVGACIAVFTLVVTPFPAGAETNALCALVQHEGRLDLEVYELEVQRADARLAAAEQIFKLADELLQVRRKPRSFRKDKLIERIIHLWARHDLDVARIDVKRTRLLLKRQQALTTIYDSTCEAHKPERIEAARREYMQADCHRIGKELAIAEADLAFNTEWMASVVNLRQGGVATAQEVTVAKERVEISRREIRHHASRVQACIDSGAAAGK